MLTCSDKYTVRNDFTSNKRYLFKGKHCNPLSPADPLLFKSEEMMERNDQLVKILQRFEKIDTDKDLCFLTDDNQWSYAMKAIETSKIQDRTTLAERFEDSDPDLVRILQQMLEFNPYFRPTAAQLIESKVFDKVRVPKNEKLDPISSLKNKIKVDHNDYRYDYELDKNVRGDQKTLDKILSEIVEEYNKLSNGKLKK